MKFRYVLLILLLIIVAIVAIKYVRASEIQSLGTARQGYNITLLQGCANSTYSNISVIQYPNKSIALSSDKVMAKSGNNYKYGYADTSALGSYLVYGHCDENGVDTPWAYDFDVTAQGLEYTVPQAIIYVILLMILIGVFGFSIYVFMIIPFNNPTVGDGEVVNVDYKKYIKIGMFALAYVCFIGITYFAWNISYGILQFTEMANFFQFMFRTSFILILPMAITLFVFGTIRFVKDMKIAKDLMRGLTVR